MTNRKQLLKKLEELRKEIPELNWQIEFDYAVAETAFIVGIYRVGLVDPTRDAADIKAGIRDYFARLLETKNDQQDFGL
jgi:hypothetical protein